jgi:hypothetical protein
MSKLDLKAFSIEALTEIMAIRPSLMTVEQVKVYKKVKLENWLAKKDGKSAPWNFPSAKGGSKSTERIRDIDLSSLTKAEKIQVPEEDTQTVPFSAVAFNERIPSWQKIPTTINVQELLGRVITCKLGKMQEICKILVNEKNEVYAKSESGIKCSIPLPHLYRAWKYGTVLVNPPRIEIVVE